MVKTKLEKGSEGLATERHKNSRKMKRREGEGRGAERKLER